mmetsp:Transcript_6093/g.7297  ORF Transcript_6093/g.7297 Transcript_6093/m.7297 type:complete len:202 (-) Transcript_6093:544-1149(-)
MLLGVEQIWMMLELTLRIRQLNFQVQGKQTSTGSRWTAEKTIKCGRLAVIFIEILTLLASVGIVTHMILVYDLSSSTKNAKDRTNKIDDFMGHYFSAFFSFLLICLTAAVITLIYNLKQKGLLMGTEGDNSEGMKQETRQIGVILATISLSFGIELIWDIFFSCESGISYANYMLWQNSAVLFVILPIFAILCLHRKNFTA